MGHKGMLMLQYHSILKSVIRKLWFLCFLVIFGIDNVGDSTTGDGSVCEFFNVLAFCLNGSFCEDNNGVPVCR